MLPPVQRRRVLKHDIVYDIDGIAWIDLHWSVRKLFRIPILRRKLALDLFWLLQRPKGARFREDWLQTIILDKHTRPKALIGQRGVIVRRNLSGPFRVLGVYEGFLARPSRRPCASTMVHAWELPSLVHPRRWDEYELDGARDGNECISFVNDFRLNIEWEEDPRNDCERRMNAFFQPVLVRGTPFFILMSTRSLRAGEAVWVDYGREYWGL